MTETAPEAQQLPVEHPPLEEVMKHLDYHLRQEDPAAREALRKHDVVAGIAGEIGDRLSQTRVAVQRQEAAAAAAASKEQELMQEARDNPDAFAERFLVEQGAAIAQRDIASLRFTERKALADQIGRATADLPEWKELTPDDMAQLAQAVTGVPDNQVIAAYQRAVVDVVAKKRAQKQSEAVVGERVRAEREAWETERAATQVRTGPAPTLRRGEGVASNEAPDSRTDPQAYNLWYEANVLRRPRRTP